MKKQQDSSSRRNFLKQGVVAATAGAAVLGFDGETGRGAAKGAVSDKKMPTGKIGVSVSSARRMNPSPKRWSW